MSPHDTQRCLNCGSTAHDADLHQCFKWLRGLPVVVTLEQIAAPSWLVSNLA